MAELNKVLRIMLTREIDRYARDFLVRHPEAVVVHIGCGLDSRFERVDNGQVDRQLDAWGPFALGLLARPGN